ncbi:MAG: UDP-N-acetylmuramoyl-L-alanine--D-glutamate ligase [Gammaproteobacteria bacterium]|nr:UDP-N-acetylmuramoyl-L-alanine--D-glutamate ligase [Gammaproteobacteria bacterium]
MPLSGQKGLSVIVGLGKTGLAVARHLHARGIDFAVTDTRFDPPGLDELKGFAPDALVSLGSLDGPLLNYAREIIVSPGLDTRRPEFDAPRALGVPIIGDIELFAREARAPVIAITGSNGKSTVTTLTAELLEAAGLKVAVGGNLGTPALELLALPVPDVYVLELSSYQLETTHGLRPKAATLLNLSPDHLDRYGTLEAYLAAKQRVFAGAELAVVNADEPAALVPSDFTGHRITFGTGADACWAVMDRGGEPWLAKEGHYLLSAGELRIKGRHNLANALASLALAASVSGRLEPMLERLRQFAGLPHRCQFVCEKNGVGYYDDSKGTNVGASLAAIAGLGGAVPGRLLLILGGDGKGQDFSPLTSALAASARAVVLIGRDAEAIAEILPEDLPVARAADMAEAVAASARMALRGDAVLLSPACASLDMFRNYEHRGHVFAESALALSGEEPVGGAHAGA